MTCWTFFFRDLANLFYVTFVTHNQSSRQSYKEYHSEEYYNCIQKVDIELTLRLSSESA